MQLAIPGEMAKLARAAPGEAAKLASARAELQALVRAELWELKVWAELEARGPEVFHALNRVVSRAEAGSCRR